MDMEHWCNDTDRRKPKSCRKACTIDTLSNPIYNDVSTNLDFGGKWSATSRLSYGATIVGSYAVEVAADFSSVLQCTVGQTAQSPGEVGEE